MIAERALVHVMTAAQTVAREMLIEAQAHTDIELKAGCATAADAFTRFAKTLATTLSVELPK